MSGIQVGIVFERNFSISTYDSRKILINREDFWLEVV